MCRRRCVEGTFCEGTFYMGRHFLSIKLTPDLELDVVVGLAERVGGLALVAAAVRLLRRRNQELGGHVLQLTDHGHGGAT